MDSTSSAGERVSQGTRIREIERQLEVAQQIAHMGSWEWDPATNSITWSDELYRIYGIEPRSREITFESFLGNVHPEDRAMIQREVGKALAEGGTRFSWVERIVRPDGSIRTLDTIGEVTRDPGGQPTGLIGCCRDITDERKRDEQIQRYADIVRNLRIGLSTWHVGNPEDIATVTLIAFNPATELLARMPLADAVGKTIREVIPYASGGRLETLIQQVARDGAVREASVLRSRDPANPTRAVSIKAFPLPGSCVGIAIEDITAATITRTLQEAEHRILEMIAEGAPLASVLSTIVTAIEAHSPPVVGAIHLRDADGARYPERVAPSMRDLGDLKVYAVAPILASDERDLGDFVLYVHERRAPSDEDRVVLERAAHLARIAIERRQLEDQLRELSAHVESVREDERTGIAREIHDELGQALTALKMDIAWIVRRESSESLTLTSAALVEKLKAMSKMTDEVIQQVRRISAELRPGVLDDLGLVAAIEWQAQEFEARTGTVCAVRSNVSEAPLERRVTTAVFRIFQEALTNVTRHAEAKHVDVQLFIDRDALELEVRDDGNGITPEAARSPKSLGLLGVRERARRLGGSVILEPVTPRGTRVALSVPLLAGSAR